MLKNIGLTSSTSEAIRMIEQNAVKVNRELIKDKNFKLKPGETYIVEVGKRRSAKVTLKKTTF